MASEKISIIVPCYNQAKFLDECLHSVINQTYNNWECILINDGSTDDTEIIAKKWTEKDVRFKYFYKENGGLSSARNAGLKIANGEWIQFLDCDDLLESEKFEKSFSDDLNYDIILSEFKILKNNTFFKGYNKLKTEYFNFEKILMDWNMEFTIPIHTGLISSKLLLEFEFNTAIKSYEDWLMWLHIFHQKPKAGFIDEPLAIYRKEDSVATLSSNLNNLLEQNLLALPIVKKLYGDEIHDKLCYRTIKVRTTENFTLKAELRKIQNERLISKYLKLKRFYYKITNQ